MRSLSFYCGDHLNPPHLKYMGHLAVLQSKIRAAEKVTEELSAVNFMERDNYRLFCISKAIRDWQEQIKEMGE